MSRPAVSVPPPDAARSWRGFDAELQASAAPLRRLALFLTRNGDDAEDLVQETLMRAWAARERFTPGTSLNAWTRRIMHNAHLARVLRFSTRFEIEDPQDAIASAVAAPPAQEWSLALREVGRGVLALPQADREDLISTALEGVSYGAAARSRGCSVAAMKSRVWRARQALREAGLGAPSA
jgi:RNA polymerase sigma-70 factor (ECF subfamily)